LLLNKEIPADIAMTGEITIKGRILPIGGLKDKLLAANRAGIKKVFIPKENEKNLIDIPEDVKNSLKIVPVETLDELYQSIFLA
jgi:ATP-dependent Lon protease